MVCSRRGRAGVFAAVTVGVWLAGSAYCGAWSGYDVTEDGLRLSIDEVADVTRPEAPTPVIVRVANTGRTPLAGRIALRDLVDDWHVVGADEAAFSLAAGATRELSFRIASGPFVFDALYPVHAYATVDGRSDSVHAVRIFKVARAVDAVPAARAFVPVRAPADGALFLWTTNAQRVVWQYYDGKPVAEAPGWSGSDPVSRASAVFTTATRGESSPALSMHPPYRPRGGSVFCDYLVSLPDRSPLTFTFANAIRDSRATEPASDGVLFRVWVGDARDTDAPPTTNGLKQAFALFTAAKTWQPGRVDLSAFAGRTVLLRLESHPGPKHNTVCDSSYWAEPTILSGESPVKAVGDIITRRADAETARQLLNGTRVPDGVRLFTLWGADATSGEAAGRIGAVVLTPGPRGLLDGSITLASSAGSVACRGLDMALLDQPVGMGLSSYACKALELHPVAGGVEYVHRLDDFGQSVPVTVRVAATGGVFRMAFHCPRRITRLSVGRWDRAARRVFYGHGYCIEKPEAFRAGFGGHNLATSHVGVEFEDGPAVLQAVDTPPDAFVVDPATCTYALQTHMDATLTLVPGRSAFACAVLYGPHYDKRPAGGVQRLAGRFCFDIWGGRYEAIADRMRAMVDYGLVDSFLTVHNWQRWGYDYRLPDVYPPNPAMGTEDDMRRIGEVCDAQAIPWGLHDNYIDFYPDAKDYSYRHVYFTRDGKPHRAWYNEGRDALSYKWRPDHIQPFVARNYALIKDRLHPSHAFLDVFTSQGCVDYWDCQGQFHSSLETRRCWGEAFAYIRETLGNNAPTTSEAGHDQLTGWLDGADCQWLTLEPKGKKHVIGLTCADWERVPWFDAANHANFILHGVGYSVRYQGGRSRLDHGINSDDYISAEIMSGHALMTDAGSWGRQAVRKYWLAQDWARHVAGRAIAAVAFDGGDMHRVRVAWDDGATACVNRGATDWTVEGHVLPPYGFSATYGQGYWCRVEKIGEAYAESSYGPSGWFCNARPVSAEPAALPIAPRIEDFARNDADTVTWTLVWDCRTPTPEAMRVFVHFCSDDDGGDTILFQGDYTPSMPSTGWHGEVRHQRRTRIPGTIEGRVRVYVGLHGNRGRANLRGASDGQQRILVGTLAIDKRADGTRRIALLPPPESGLLAPPRWNPTKPLLDFGFARTDGAFRLSGTGEGRRLRALPDSDPFKVELGGRTYQVASGESVAIADTE